MNVDYMSLNSRVRLLRMNITWYPENYLARSRYPNDLKSRDEKAYEVLRKILLEVFFTGFSHIYFLSVRYVKFSAMTDLMKQIFSINRFFYESAHKKTLRRSTSLTLIGM